MTFCVTGTLSATRKEIQQRITDAGGKIVGSVSANLNVLVAGEKAGSKLTKATNLGVDVWSEDDLTARLGGSVSVVNNAAEASKEDGTVPDEPEPKRSGQFSLSDFS